MLAAPADSICQHASHPLATGAQHGEPSVPFIQYWHEPPSFSYRHSVDYG